MSVVTLDDANNRIVCGADYDVERDFELLDGESAVEAWLTIKESEFDDMPALQKHVIADDSSDSSGDGQLIEDSGGIHLLFRLTPDDTGMLDAYTQYVYEIQIKTTSDRLFGKERGILVPLPQIT